MKIAVLAAGGRSGREFVTAALQAGHEVRAGVRGLNPFPEHKLLTVVTCDAANKNDIANLVKGQDAVVSLIGHVKGSPTDVQSRATWLLIAAMKAAGIRRIVSLTGTGVRFPGDKITAIDRLLNTAIAIVDPKRVRDGRVHADLLMDSGLDWTILRVLKLQDTPEKPFNLGINGPAKTIVSRAEVAQAILQVLSSSSFIGGAPIICQV